MRQDLDTYIHFVKAVSTLTPQQLDTPDPQIVLPPIVPVTVVSPQLVAKGDFNGDLVVDKADYVKFRNLMGTTTSPFAGADATGDGLIDEADYMVWKQNFGQQLAQPGPTTPPVVSTSLAGTREAQLVEETPALATADKGLLLETTVAKQDEKTAGGSTTTTIKSSVSDRYLETRDLAFETWGL
jgi:hypothetical protein